MPQRNTPVTDSIEPAQSRGRIARDMPCLTCGYNLRTLAVDARCPECGGTVADTLDAWNAESSDAGVIYAMGVSAGMLFIFPLATAFLCIVAAVAGLGAGQGVPALAGACPSILFGIVYFFPTVGFVHAARLVQFGCRAEWRRSIVFLCFVLGLIGHLVALASGFWAVAVGEFALLVIWSTFHARMAMRTLGSHELSQRARVTLICGLITLVAVGLQIGAQLVETPLANRSAGIGLHLILISVLVLTGSTMTVLQIWLMWGIENWLAARRDALLQNEQVVSCHSVDSTLSPHEKTVDE